MNIKQLECFYALAQTLNFSKAADELYISQSSFSRIIASLEEELGCVLIERSKTNPRLTEAGEKIKTEAAAVLERIAVIKMIAESSNKGYYGSYKIGTLWGGLQDKLSSIMECYVGPHQEVVFDVEDYPENDLIRALESGNIDAALFVSPPHPVFDKFDSIVITSRPRCLICDVEHPYAKESHITLDQIENEEFITMKPGRGFIFNDCFNKTFEGTHIKPFVKMQANTSFALMDHIAAGLGVTIIGEEIVELTRKNIVAVPIENISRSNQYLLFRKDEQREAVLELKELARKLADR